MLRLNTYINDVKATVMYINIHFVFISKGYITGMADTSDLIKLRLVL